MSGEPIWPGSLKCVSAWSRHRPLRGRMQVILEDRVRPEDIWHLHGDAFVVYTEADTAAVRDWLAPLLKDDESVFVVEFERWSGYGPAPDRDWLLWRGH